MKQFFPSTSELYVLAHKCSQVFGAQIGTQEKENRRTPGKLKEFEKNSSFFRKNSGKLSTSSRFCQGFDFVFIAEKRSENKPDIE